MSLSVSSTSMQRVARTSRVFWCHTTTTPCTSTETPFKCEKMSNLSHRIGTAMHGQAIIKVCKRPSVNITGFISPGWASASPTKSSSHLDASMNNPCTRTPSSTSFSYSGTQNTSTRIHGSSAIINDNI